MVWYSHLFQNFPQFIVIHTVNGFGIVNKAEIDVFLELSCLFHDPADVGNLVSGSSAFSKTSLNIRKFMVHLLLKPGLENFEHNSRKNEGMEPKQNQYPVVDVTDDRSMILCCKEQYCIGTCNVRSMNQGKLEVVKQEMARVNVNILGIGELKWTGMGEFNSDDHYIYYCGQESLRRNGVAIILSVLRLHPSTAFWTLLLTMMATPFLLRCSCLQ